MSIQVISYFEPRGSGYVVQQQHIKGSFRSVADATERDNIPLSHRATGMMVYSISNSVTYILLGGITNSNWSIYNSPNGYSQPATGTSFIVNHNLYKYPSISCINNNNSLVVPNFVYINTTGISLNFKETFTGNIYLS